VNVSISLISVPAVVAAASAGLASTVTATLAGGTASSP
jgi:hypothetical protein